MQLSTTHELDAFGAVRRLSPIRYIFTDAGRIFGNQASNPGRRLHRRVLARF